MKHMKSNDKKADRGEWIYRINPAPEKLTLDEYIQLYQTTGEDYYFHAFLHYYEPSLNRRTMRFCYNYWVEHLFLDVKQTIVTTLFEYADKYDTEKSVPFLAYTSLMVREAVHDMIRINGGVHSIANASHYRRLRKVNYLHYFNRDQGMTDYQSAQMIAEELNMTVSKVFAMIAEGKCFRDFESLAERQRDLSDEDAPDVYDKYDKGDRTADPGEVVPNALFMDEIVDAIEELSYKQQQILYLSSGISCLPCGRICNRKTYAGLANSFELYSESTVEKQRKQAIRKMRERFAYIEEWF